MGLNEPEGLVVRFNVVERGYIVTTGNTLSCSTLAATLDSGPFLTTDTSKQVPGYPAGTTTNWQENSSMAVLNYTSESTVLYAELIWFSTVKISGYDFSGSMLNAVKFTTPSGISNITPQNSQGATNCFRSADVTSIVANAGPGNYTLGGVAGVCGTNFSATRFGWGLVVVLGNNSQPYRVLRVDTGSGSAYFPVTENITLQNFGTPSSGTVTGRVNFLIGDGDLTDYCGVSAGPSTNSLVSLGNSSLVGSPDPGTSPNNPKNGIFAGMINIADPLDPNVGLIDTRGTFGNRNHNPYTLAYNNPARNKWDITSLDLSPALTNSQSQLVIQCKTPIANSVFNVLQIATQVDIHSPSLSFQFSVEQSTAYLGQTITYKAEISNSGGASAENVTYQNPFSSSVVFNSGSVVVNGVSQPSSDPNAGFSIGNINPGQTVTVSYSLKCIVAGSSWTLGNKGTVYYSFQPITGTTINASLVSNRVVSDLLDLAINKSVDRNYASIGYTLTYTVTIQNLGLKSASNLKLTDSIPPGTKLVANSLAFDNAAQVGADPSASVILPDIAGGVTLTIAWKVAVENKIPDTNPITNVATIDTQVGVVKTTNSVSTQINYADLVSSGNLSKSADKAYADLDEIITYTFNMKNTGNVIADNVFLQDTLPSWLTFVAGSATINGVVNNSTPDVGINVKTVNAGSTATVTIQGKVTSLPDASSNPISNVGNFSYAFTVDPASPNAVAKYISTNASKTQISNATITAVQSVDKQYVDVGATISYSVLLTNTGNVSANNIIFKNQDPTGVSFVSGSVTIGGVSTASANPNTGFSIPNIPAKGTTTVTFKIKVGNSIPSQNPVASSSTITHDYIVNPNNPPVIKSITSNSVTTQVNHANLLVGSNFVKTVDKQYADLGDILTYTITIKNSGNVSANSVNITDTLGTGLSYQSGTLTIDGTADNTSTPTTGISLSSMASNQTKVIIFKVQINSMPLQNPISNVAKVSYTYTVDPALPNAVSTNGSTTPSTTQVNHGELITLGNSTKAVDLAYAKVGNILTYNLNFKNTGNVPVNNVTVTDVIPASSAFVSGSVIVNGNANSSANPALGLNVGSINQNATTNMIFKVKVTSLPSSNTIINQANFTYNYTVNPSVTNGVSKSGGTNTVSTTVSQPDFVGNGNNFVKTVDKQYADLGTILTYTLTFKNTGNTSATSVVLNDIIQTGATFKTGTVVVNGASNASADPNAGINIGTVSVNQTIVVTYKVTVNTLPATGVLDDFASLTYNYTLNPANPNSESDTVNSNTVTTVINHADLITSGNLTKAVDKQFADLNEIVTYTLTISNTGNVSANNVTVTDSVPTGAIYEAGSLSINGIANSGDITQGVNIGSIAKTSSSTVKFKVKITTIPTQNPISNSANVAYVYTVDPATPNGASASGITNSVTTQINNGTLTLVKSTNKQYADTNEIITYSVLLTNTGNVSSTNVTLLDLLPSGTSFITNSVTIASLPKPGQTPVTGINVGTILGGANVTVTFQAQVSSTIPTQNPVGTSSTVSYKYLVDPSNNPLSKNLTSNLVTTQINHANLLASGNFVKSVNKLYADIGDSVTYTINVTNSGNISANNVVIKDIIGNGATYSANTLTIDGVASSDNPNNGINVGTVSLTQTRVIVFSVNITSIPTQNPISNGASVNYSYTVNPATPNGVLATATTNNVNTTINHAELLATGNVTISVDKSYAKLNDVLTYTVNLKNSGNSNATDVTINDVLPQELSFVVGSVVINGTPNITLNPTASANIGTINANTTTTVTFKAKANSLPSSKVVNNGITFSYSYTIDPTNLIIVNKNGSTSTVQTTIIQPGFGSGSPNSNFVNAVDKQYADIGDILTYTITIKNSGNTIANNLVLKDTIPQGANFKSGTVTINGTASSSANPNTGITIGSLDINQTSIVAFKATVISIPVGTLINNQASLNYTYTVDPAYPNGETGTLTSNISSTTVNNANILSSGNFIKSVDKIYADIGEIVTYTVNIKNTGSVSANNVVFTDVIPIGTTYQAGTLIVNGTANSGNLSNGVNIGTISSSSTKTLVFKVKVTSMPAQNPIQNTSSIAFNYTIDPASPNGKSGSGTSNQVSTQINTSEITTTQSVNKQFAGFSDIITYSFTLTNSGNVTANEILFTNPIPQGTSLVADSVIVGGIVQNGVDPSTGVSIGSINASSNVVVSFQVKLGNSIPVTNPIPNSASVTFSYLVDPNGTKKTGTSNSNTVTTQVVHIDLSTAGSFTKTVDKQYATIGDVITYTLNIQNPGNISANNVIVIDSVPSGSSYKADTLTVNGNHKNDDPSTGINVGTIPSMQSAVIVFSTKVDSIPPDNPLSNVANLTYNYTVDPNNPNSKGGTSTSNSVITKINYADLSTGSVTQTIDKTFASVGDTLTFTVSLKNNGNVPINNLIFTDVLDPALSLVPSSITVNGTPNNAGSLTLGVNAGTVNIGNTATITFQAKINSLPAGGSITNTPNFNCTFTVDPSSQNGVSISGSGTPVSVTVLQPGFGSGTGGIGSGGSSNPNFVNMVDKQYGDVGDLLTYTITIKNAGNVIANNVILTDAMTKETTFKSGSVVINGTAATGASPITGINIGSIDINQTAIVNFKATVVGIPQNNTISNQAGISYSYTLDPAKPNGKTGSLTSNVATTGINSVNILGDGNFVKSVDKLYADIGDIVTYTVNIKNTGSVSANNVVFTDVIPTGAIYQTGTLTINGTANSGNLSTGINIGTISSNSAKIVIFKAKIASMPTQNPIQNTSSIAFKYTTDPAAPNGKSGSGNSNQVSTQINTSDITTTQTVNKQYADFSDIITYTFTLANTGNLTANEVTFTNPIPSGTSLVTDSLTLNGVIQNGVNPSNGFLVGNISANSNVVVTFQVKVENAMPSINPISNTGSVNFSYIFDPSSPKKSKTSTSNAVTTQIVHIDLSTAGNFTKTVDKQYATIGDIVTYTLTVQNPGNVPANNVVVIDSVPNGSSYKSGTLTVNGTSKSDDPSTGINVGTIPAMQNAVIVFNAKVDSVPPDNPLSNVANLTYNYTVDPNSPNSKGGTSTSNAVTTKINYADLSTGNVTQTVDKTFASVGDTLTFTVSLKNNGNVPINNLIFTDALDPALSLVPSSIIVNGTPNNSGSLTLGVNVGTVNIGATATITFQAKINSLPTEGSITNTPNFNCTFTVDPSSQNGVSVSGSGTPVSVTVVQAGFGGGTSSADNPNFVNSVDKQYGDIGDLLTYTVTIKNAGNVIANNVILTDAMTKETTFKAGSVVINGTAATGASPITGITIGSIDVNQTAIVNFKATVVGIPQNNTISNQASISYSYTLDPAKPNGKTGSLTSNVATTGINSVNILGAGNFVKSVDKVYADIGDIVTYTVNIKNTGSVSANNVIFTDIIPTGATYQTGSLTINGTANSGNLSTGINIGTISSNSIKTLIFKAKISSMPSQNPIQNTSSIAFKYTTDPAAPNGKSGSGNSNQVSTQINTSDITTTQTVNKQYAGFSDIITYTFNLANTGNLTANEVTFTNQIPSGTSFVNDSLTLNGIIQNGINPNSGFLVGNISSNSSAVVTFQVKVGNTIPSVNPISNTGSVNFSYVFDPTSPKKSKTSTSNAVNTEVIHIDLSTAGSFTKTVDKQYATIGDLLTYTLTVQNPGNAPANNVVVIDSVPSGSSYKSGTLTVNGTTKNDDPSTGINVGTIPSMQSAVIVFNVKIDSVPTDNPLSNVANLTYNYTVDPNSPNSKGGTSTSNSVKTQVNYIDLSTGNVTQTVDKTFASVGDTLTFTVLFKNMGNVPINNLIFTDELDPTLSLIPSSITVNGNPSANGSLSLGVNVGTVNTGATSTITFQAKINSVPNGGTITNTPNFNCTYTVDPSSQNGVSINGSSPPVTVTIVAAGFGGGTSGDTNPNFVNTVDKQYADVGDLITYTITIKNSGNVVVNNVILTDAMTKETTFKSGSVVINGTASTGASPVTGITIGSIDINQTAVVSFKATINAIPQNNIINNQANISYKYTLDPAKPNGQTGTLASNIAITNVNSANILGAGNFVKTVDKLYADIGELITYTVNIKNTGSVSANNVIFTDVIPTGATYQAGTLTINGTSNGNDPNTGINIGTINSNTTKTLIFKAKVVSIPSKNPIQNTSSITFNYTTDPASPNGKSGSGNSNQVSTQINTSNITTTQSVNKQFAGFSDIITYSFTLANAGNVAANEVIFTNPIPQGTTIVANSVTLGGIVKNNVDPSSGFAIGSINANSSVVLTFKVQVGNSLPSINPISNKSSLTFSYLVDPNATKKTGAANSNLVTTEIVNIDLNTAESFIKAVDKQFATIGDIITYTLTIQNPGNIPANNVVVIDSVPSGSSYKSGTLTVNGTAKNDDPNTGINIGTIPVNQNAVVVFSTKVDSVPPQNPLSSVANLTYNYTIDPSNPNSKSGTSLSNTVTTKINYVDLSTGNVSQIVDKTSASVGDVLTFTVSFKNNGNVPINNLIFTDNLDPALSLVANSITVNGNPNNNGSLNLGVNIGTVNTGDLTTISFKAKINALPSSGNIINTPNFNCTYTVDPSSQNGVSINGSSPPVTVTVVQPGFGSGSGGIGGGGNSNPNFVNTVDKLFADIDDLLTYTITLKNSGNIIATNVILTNALTKETKFKPGTVIVNGTAATSASPITGIAIGNIDVNQTATISFKANVMAIPQGNYINNQSSITYNYTTDPSKPNNQSGTLTSNIATTKVNSVNILAPGNFVKSVDKNYVDIGDIITYTVDIKNSGSVSANNIVFTDLIPNGASYQTGSLTVNGIANSGNPNNGVNIGTITSNSTKTVIFKAKVTSIPSQNPLQSSSSIIFNYTTDPASPNAKSGSGISNQVSTQVSNSNVTITQSADKQYVGFSDIITYSFTIINTGNVPANEIIFNNPISQGITFIPDSLTLGGSIQVGSDPSSGFAIGSIGVGASQIITFQVKTGNSIPNVNPITNNASISFSYLIDTGGSKKVGVANSNAITTKVINANLYSDGNFIKEVNKQYATLGDILTYTISIKNTGNTPANNVLIIDSMPSEVNYQAGSLTVNGNSQNDDPNIGITIESIPVNQTAIIVFNTKITSEPKKNPLSNKANLTYNYTIDPNNPNSAEEISTSNAVTTQINYVDLSTNTGNVTQTVDKTFASVGDNLTFTVSFKNTGNVPINNLVFTDTLDNSLSLVPNSITVNGTLNPTGSLTLGVGIGTVNTGGVSTISFQAKINSLPSGGNITNTPNFNCKYTIDPNSQNSISINGISNPVTVTVVQPGFGGGSDGTGGAGGGSSPNFVNTVDKQYSDVGELLTYTIAIKNAGNVIANNVILKDIMTKETLFKPGSVVVDGIANSSATPVNGVNIGNIDVGKTVTIVFKATITAIPQNNAINNQATLSYTYTLDPTKPNSQTGSLTSNIATTTVNNANLIGSGNFVKSVDKLYADIGELLTYTINVNNSGSVAANNVIFTDVIPTGAIYETGTLTINGTPNSGDPNLGVNVGTINSNTLKTIIFKTKITAIPSQNPLQNSSSIAFNYTTDPASLNGKNGTGTSNTVSTQINNANLALTQTVDKQYAGFSDVVTYSFTLTNTGNIPANEVVFTNIIPDGVSFIGNSLTVGGITQTNVDTNRGFSIGTIAANFSSIIKFQVQINNSVPAINPIENKASVAFSYLVDPNATKKIGSTTSNPVTTKVINANIISNDNFTKTVDKQYADIGDLLTYTINVKNSGNTAANNVVVVDSIPNGAIFKTGSLTINGASKNNDPNIGINVGSIPSNQTVNIVFSANVVSMPTQNPLSNLANLTYTYTIDPNNPNSGVGTGESNAVTTKINHADLLSTGNVVQSVNKTFATIGEILTFTIKFKNSGNIPINNLLFTDTLDPVLSLVPNSINVNGNQNNNGNLISGVNIGTVQEGDTATITFQAKINALPPGGNISNTPSFNCTYTVDPSVNDGVKISASTNPVTITILQPGFGGVTTDGSGNTGNFKQSVDKNYADLGDLVTYTFTIKNSGNIPANNVVLTDVVPNGTNFKIGSVMMDGINSPFANPNVGINIGTIYQNQTTNVSFQVVVINVIQPAVLTNSATMAFTYTLDPNRPNAQSQTLTSNQTTVNIVHGEIISKNAIKSADKVETTAGDIVTYTVSAKNTGNVDLLNVTLEDSMPKGVSFVLGSVLINSVASTNSNPTLGINLGTISPNSTVIIIFRVKVDENADNILSNTAKLNYNYFVDPSKAAVSTSVDTNKIVIQNVKPNIKITTVSDRIGGINGNIVKYTVTAQNITSIKVNGVILKLSLSDKLEYIGNVTINGIENSGNILTGVNVGDLEANQSITLTFDAKIIFVSIQSLNELSLTLDEDFSELATTLDNEIINDVVILYNYTINNGGENFTNTVTTQGNTVKVYSPSVVLEKNCNKSFVKEGDTFIYNIMATNTGDIDISDTIIKDNIPAQFSVQEIKVDGVVMQGNVSTGISIGSIPIGTTKITSLTVKALSINPNLPIYINQVEGDFKIITDPNLPAEIMTKVAQVAQGITVLKPSISLVKSSSINYAAVNDLVTYKIVVSNTGDNITGNLTLSNVIVKDVLTPELEFVNQTLKIDGVEYPDYHIIDGVNLGDLNINQSKSITFDVKVLNDSKKSISNTAVANYNFKLDINSPIQFASITSNSTIISINNPGVSITKQVNKNTASLSDILTYTISIKNIGDLELINILFKDNPSDITKIVEGSFKLNGRIINSVELIKGIAISSLKIGEILTINYDCVVTGTNPSGKAENTASVDYSYTFLDGTTGSNTLESNKVIVLINVNSFKQFSINEYIQLPTQKPDIKQASNVTGTVEILKFNVIETAKATSIEGQKLSGYKLIVHGVIKEIVEYIANDASESIHAVHKDVSFSTFIVLPPDYIPGSKFDVSAILEKAYASRSDARSLFSNAVILIKTQILQQ